MHLGVKIRLKSEGKETSTEKSKGGQIKSSVKISPSPWPNPQHNTAARLQHSLLFRKKAFQLMLMYSKK